MVTQATILINAFTEEEKLECGIRDTIQFKMNRALSKTEGNNHIRL